MPRAWVFGDNVSTDDIIAGRYLFKRDLTELGRHAMENIRPDFAGSVRRGDVVIAGRNFGCGSSREQAPIALKGAGISAVVAESFARIFYRNAINQGLPAVICKGVRDGFRQGDEVELDLRAGVVRNLSTGRTFRAEPLPDFILEIINAGGLLQYLKKRPDKLRPPFR